MDGLRHWFGQAAWLGLAYTFGARAKAKSTTFDYDQ
jgi:hypothetical protein